YDQVVAQSAFQPQAGYAKRLVLVGVVAIDHTPRRFRHAPGNAAAASVLDLSANDAAAGLVEKGIGKDPHQEHGHQVLEHRGAPRQHRGNAVDADRQATQMETVFLWHVAPG